MNRKIVLINVTLLVVILFLGYLLMNTRFSPPEAYAFSTIKDPDQGEEQEEAAGEEPETPPVEGETEYAKKAIPKPKETIVADADDKYPNFGAAPIFDTIIPKPTPTPRPTPKPKPPPDINRVTARWSLRSLMGNTATFYDSGTKKEWTMKVGEVYEQRYRNENCPIKLDSVDENTFKVKVTFGEQERSFSLF